MVFGMTWFRKRKQPTQLTPGAGPVVCGDAPRPTPVEALAVWGGVAAWARPTRADVVTEAAAWQRTYEAECGTNLDASEVTAITPYMLRGQAASTAREDVADAYNAAGDRASATAFLALTASGDCEDVTEIVAILDALRQPAQATT